MTPTELMIPTAGPSGEPAELACTWFAPEGTERAGTLVCLPGGTYDRHYFHVVVPGREGYSFAEHAAANGFGVLTVDLLGTGASSRPATDVTWGDQADALAAGLPRLPDPIGRRGPLVAVAHSMGGYVALIQQARHRSYTGLAVLGTTVGPVGPLGLPSEMIDAAATPDGRSALYEQLLAGFAEREMAPDRHPMRSWFHLPDVPDDVIAADDAQSSTVVLRAGAAAGIVPRFTGAEAALVDVPVLLGYGEVDVSLDPASEPRWYPASPAVTVHIQPGSAHCHNLATTRVEMWDRVLSWAAAVSA